MAIVNNTTGSGLVTQSPQFTPEAVGKLVETHVKANSVAARTSTVIGTDKDSMVFPVYAQEPSVGFYSELDPIAESDMDTDEIKVDVFKTAGLVLSSAELLADSSPEIGPLVGQGLSNKIARAIDGAFLADTTAKGPNGLLSVSYSEVDTGASVNSLDPFVEARYKAQAAGSKLTSWIVSPVVAEALSKIKVQSGSQLPLLQFVEDGSVSILGLPVVVSDQVDANTLFWGVPKDHVVLLSRTGTVVETFPNVERHGVWVRAVARFGIGYLNEGGIVRGYNVT